MNIRKIVVATDFSADSQAALRSAVELSAQLGAQIHVVHAYYAWIPPVEGEPAAVGEFVKATRDAAQTHLEELAKAVAQQEVPCETHLSADERVSAILELAKALPADLIVMGTRGLTGLKHVLLGSVAERVVRLAPCPVLTVKSSV